MIRKKFFLCGAGAAIFKKRKILLVKEKTGDRFTKKRADQWGLPGGGMEDASENLIATVKREIKEETGYEIKPLSLLGLYQIKIVGPIFRARIIGKRRLPFNHNEITEIRFFSKEGIEKMKEEEFRPGHRQIILTDAFNKKRRLPLSFYRFLGKSKRK